MQKIYIPEQIFLQSEKMFRIRVQNRVQNRQLESCLVTRSNGIGHIGGQIYFYQLSFVSLLLGLAKTRDFLPSSQVTYR